MKSIKKIGLIGIFLILSLNLCFADVNCSITSCKDIRVLAENCSIVTLANDVSIYNNDCITMSGQSFDLNGFTVTSTGVFNPYASIRIYGSGSVINGKINGNPIYTNSQTGNIVINNIVGIESFLRVNSGDGVVYIGNSKFYGIISANDLNIQSVNLSLMQINGNGVKVFFKATQILAGVGYGLAINTVQDTTLNIESLRLCQAHVFDFYTDNNASHNIINNLGNQFYYDLFSGNYTLTGNQKRDCYEFQGFQTINSTNQTQTDNIICENPIFTTLESVGLTKFWTIRRGDNIGINAKITFKNKTKYDSLNITSNMLCFENTQNNELVICKDSQTENIYFGDIMRDNLQGNFSITVGNYEDYYTNWLGFIVIGGINENRRNNIINQYCAPYFTYNSLIDWVNPYSYCDNGGLKYELLDSEIMSGKYNEYLVLKSNDNCILKIKLSESMLNGNLLINGIDIKSNNIHSEKQAGDNANITIPADISTKTTHDNITFINDSVKVFDWSKINITVPNKTELIGFLNNDYGLNFTENVSIDISEDNKTITLTENNETIILKINDSTNTVTLTCNNKDYVYIYKINGNQTNVFAGASEICVTFFDYNTNDLKYKTIIFHLVENMSNYYDTENNESKIIAECEAAKNMLNDYASCSLCFNATKNNFYAYFTEFINEDDKQDDIFYIGSFSTNSLGNINESYRVYINENGENTSRDINYSGGWLYGYSVNQTYYYYEAEAEPGNYDLITMLMIIMIIAFIGIGVFSVLSKNKKQKQ